MSFTPNTPSPIARQHELGKAIAQLYIIAQESTSQAASTAACELIEKEGLWAKRAFNNEMEKTSYNVRASSSVE
jgi:hypothetical protein